MSISNIEWTDETWNPLTGCNKVSTGCLNCYAEETSKWLKGMGNRRYLNGFDLTLHYDKLCDPEHWAKGQLIFVNSMSDLFHEDVPFDFIREVFATMCRADQHIYQILTKRAERLRMLASDLPWPSHVWMGVSVENDEPIGSGVYAPTHRIDDLRATEAAMKWLSLEPLIGPLPDLDLTGIDWVVVGGESTKKTDGSRPLSVDWVRDIIRQCRMQAVPVFVKQLGTAWAVNSETYVQHKKGGDPTLWPHDVRVREYPLRDLSHVTLG